LQVGPCKITIHFWREGDASRWEVCEVVRGHGVKEEDTIQVADEKNHVRDNSH
jgi:hypothetical protein